MRQAHISWQNNQPYSEDFNDVYFSREGGVAETEYVFLQNNHLPARWQERKRYVIAETGFGTGLNFLVTADAWLKTSQADACLYYFSAEKYPLGRQDLKQALAAWPDYSALAAEVWRAWPASVAGFHYLELIPQRLVLILMLGDVLDMLRQMNTRVDAWYLDGFAPARNPDMWTADMFAEMARSSYAQTTFATYTAAGDVRRGLQAAGFNVEKVSGFAAKRDMLRGHFIQSSASIDQAPWFALPMPHYQTRRAAVIGAGVAGITTAWSLVQRGWQVDIFDSNASVAMAGSGNPAGVLLPRIAADDSAEAEFYASAFFMALRRFNVLQEKYPEFIWQQTGVLQLLSSDRLRKQAAVDMADDYVRRLSADAASQYCGIQLDTAALLYPQAGWLSPHSLCEMLLRDTGAATTTFFSTTVQSLQRQQDTWLLHDANQTLPGRYAAVVLANAQSVSQFQQTGWMDIEPARGQISYLPVSAGSQHLKCPICYDGYVLPACRAGHVVGASFESGNASCDIRVPEHEQNLRKLQQSVPALVAVALSPAGMSGRAAVRAVTPDRLPLAGAVPDMEFFKQHYSDLQKGRQATKYPAAQSLPGLFVNAGHGARGLTSAYLTAEFVAALINNDVLPVSTQVLRALHPARFFIRQSRKGKLPAS